MLKGAGLYVELFLNTLQVELFLYRVFIKHMSYLKLCIRRGCKGTLESSKIQALPSEFHSSEGEKIYQKEINAHRQSGFCTQTAGLGNAVGRHLEVGG